MGQTPEGKIKAMVKKALDALGEDCWRFMPVQTGFGTDALDFLLCIRGKFVTIETKADRTKKLTPRQLGTAARIVGAEGLVFIVYDQATLDYTMACIRLMMEFDSASPKRYRPDPLPSTFPPDGAAS